MKNILLVGVGGQGIILASEILSDTILSAGFDVKKSEIHGMSQRGGSVVSHVRFGDKIFSPTIPRGDADILVAFEKLEALRWIHYLKPKGKLIINNLELPPISTNFDFSYPKNIIEKIQKYDVNFFVVDAFSEAQALGNEKVVNSVLMGALAGLLDFDSALWESVVQKRVPQKTIDINLQAFRKGLELSKEL